MHDQMNPKQQLAISHVEGPLLVLAGAGSGKTKVVTHRIAHLIDLGILPSHILAVTFTNKAAKEMSQRVQRIQGSKVLTCTFHSLGARILRESIGGLGYPKEFTIYDEDDSDKLLKSCIEAAGHKEDKGTLKRVKLLISAAKNDLISPEHVEKDPLASQAESLFYQFYPVYQKKLQEVGAVDFDDLLFLPHLLFQKSPETLHYYQQKWLFILIDEYQDTNFAQYNLIKKLGACHKNIFAVGDPDQSIYSWRGARYENILHFEEDFKGAKTITLDQNYRSTNKILSAANHLIANNERRFKKELWSELGDGAPMKLFVGQSEQEETNFIFEQIQRHVKEDKIPLSEIVLFYRTNAQSRIYEDLFLKHNIPYRIYGGISFYQRKEIKDLIAMLKLIHSPYDIIAFIRAVPILTKGIGQATLKKIVVEAERGQIPILSICKDPSAIKISSAQRGALYHVYELFHSWRENLSSYSNVADLIDDVVSDSHYYSYLQQDPETFDDRKDNIQALTSKAVQWEEETADTSLTHFLEDISLHAPKEDVENGVTLMTLHNGKGLEFSLVFITGMEESLLPHANAFDSPFALEEERRLCYVGFTRAKRYLYLTACTMRYLWGSAKFNPLSRFIHEIPKECLEREEKMTTLALSVEDHSMIREGTRVKHKEFGLGHIEKIYHTSYGITYDVLFDTGSVKRTLVAKYANLEVC
jgi:DNA helicase II / ATP-dependent DNA helicase PcrA